MMPRRKKALGSEIFNNEIFNTIVRLLGIVFSHCSPAGVAADGAVVLVRRGPAPAHEALRGQVRLAAGLGPGLGRAGGLLPLLGLGLEVGAGAALRPVVVGVLVLHQGRHAPGCRNTIRVVTIRIVHILQAFNL